MYTAHTVVLGPVRSQSEKHLMLLKLQAGQRVTDAKLEKKARKYSTAGFILKTKQVKSKKYN